MSVFYDIIKAIFFIQTVIVGIFYLRGKFLGIADPTSQMLQSYLMPGYMLFCGIMLGYLIAHIWSGTHTDKDAITGIYIKSFIIGIILGLGLSFAYMYL